MAVVKRLTRRIVAPLLEGSIPSSHPIIIRFLSLGRSQVGKARDFDSRMRWFESSRPSQCDPLAQSVEHLTFNQGVRDSNSRGRTKKHQTVLTLSGAFLCCLSADSVHRAEIREPLRCFLLCKVQVFLHHGQACVAQNFPQAVYITAVFQVACSKRMSQQVRV